VRPENMAFSKSDRSPGQYSSRMVVIDDAETAPGRKKQPLTGSTGSTAVNNSVKSHAFEEAYPAHFPSIKLTRSFP
jgi:hypothetical protein